MVEPELQNAEPKKSAQSNTLEITTERVIKLRIAQNKYIMKLLWEDERRTLMKLIPYKNI